MKETFEKNVEASACFMSNVWRTIRLVHQRRPNSTGQLRHLVERTSINALAKAIIRRRSVLNNIGIANRLPSEQQAESQIKVSITS